MFFVMFKLPRTGSTRVVKYLDRAPGVRCIQEIFSDYEGSDYEAEIRRQLGSVPVDYDSMGFSLNPFNKSISQNKFFNPKEFIDAKGGGLIISLIRKNIFEQSVSFWLSTQLKKWPGDSDASAATQLQSYIKQGGIEIPPAKLRKIFNRFSKQNRALVAISQAFADEHGLDHLEITYEGLYNTPHSDLMNLESRLGITLDRELVAPSQKVLPLPQEWVANFDELANLLPQ